MAGIAGIGFTVSIFVAGLAFDDPAATDQAKIGVLVASAIAAALGSVILLLRHPTHLASFERSATFSVEPDGS